MDPLGVGGIGGSGTGVVASVLASASLFIGGHLNVANDNLWFTLLFKRPDILDLPDRDFEDLVALFVERMVTGPPRGRAARRFVLALAELEGRNPSVWLDRARSFLDPTIPAAEGRPWGWKDPNTHVVLPRLVMSIPRLRYVHVARNGLDMAYSVNQNQPHFWGTHFGVPFDETPRMSLRFWRRVHERVLGLGSTLGERFLFLRLEDLCSAPRATIARLYEFAGLDTRLPPEIVRMVATPPSIGRYRYEDIDVFDTDDVEYVAALGFPTEK